jgi:hypothetical protein
LSLFSNFSAISSRLPDGRRKNEQLYQTDGNHFNVHRETKQIANFVSLKYKKIQKLLIIVHQNRDLDNKK